MKSTLETIEVAQRANVSRHIHRTKMVATVGHTGSTPVELTLPTNILKISKVD